MISQAVIAVLLSIPLLSMIICSIGYWSEFRNEKKSGKAGKKTAYKKASFYLLVGGVLCMWASWIGGVIFLSLNRFYDVLGFLMFPSPVGATVQIIGLFIFYIGAITYNLNIIIAGKYLRPAPSGLLEDHELIQEGPYGIIRHPLYVSYIFILTGLSFTLLTYWLLIPALFVAIGIYPTARAEEETLIEQLGEEYVEYQRRVGMFFPRLFWHNPSGIQKEK